MNQFHDIVIRPFVELFSGFYIDIVFKAKIAISYLIVMFADAIIKLMQEPTITDTTLELIATPTQFWLGLFIVTLADFVFGAIRAATEKEIEWDWEKFGRGAYKFIVYAAALIVSATVTNMFPLIFGLFQYVIVAILAAIETHSFFRNTKMLAVLYAATEVIKQNIRPGTESFLDMVNRVDKKLIHDAQVSKSVKGEKGEKGEKGDPG